MNADYKLSQAKKKMKEYLDFFGGKLKDIDSIDNACSIDDLENILQSHHDFIGDMATDAQGSLDRFKRSLDIFKY